MDEKLWFAGHLMASILYGTCKGSQPTVRLFVLTSSVRSAVGVIVVLFFKCMAALFNPVHRRGEGIKWGLVYFTVATFSLETVCTSMSLNNLSLAYINNHKFPDGLLVYQMIDYYGVTSAIPNFAAVLNNWLVNGLLLSSLFTHRPRRLIPVPPPAPLLLRLLL